MAMRIEPHNMGQNDGYPPKPIRPTLGSEIKHGVSTFPQYDRANVAEKDPNYLNN